MLDYFFAIGSPWAYIVLNPLDEIAGRHDLIIRPRPMTLITQNGAIYSKDRPDARRAYWLTDLQCWSARRGVTLAMTDRGHLSPPDPAALTVIAAALDGRDWLTLTLRLQAAFWTERADIGQIAVHRHIADEGGPAGAALISREAHSDVKDAWQANLADATALGVFGSPTYVIDGSFTAARMP